MSLEFNYYSLGDLVKIKYGKNQKKVQDDENGKYPIYGTGGLMGYSIDYLYDKPSVLIGRKGSIEKVRYIEEPFWTVDTLFYTEVNDKIVIPKFLYYVMSLINLSRYNEGTSIPSLRTETLNRLDLPIPNLDYQKRVLTVLSNIDKKISLNKKINKNLEELIKHIYINWFEDFEPFKGNTFHDTKLGKIPNGWNVKPLHKFIKFQEGPGIRNWQYVEEDGINFLNIRCIQNNDLILNTANMISKEEANGKYAHFMLNEWDLVISSSGTLGRYAIVRKEHLPLCLNTSIIRFKPLHSINHYAYIYSYLTSRGFYHYLLTMGSGSVQLNFGPTHLKQIDLIVPPEDVLKRYNETVFPIIEKIVKIKAEINKLTKLRDTLLPKLMSGEIDVSKINCDLKIIIRKIYIKSSKLFLWRYLSENKNYIKNTKSNETLLKSRTIYKINKFLAKFNARYRYYRQ
ncbi:restriction endonuclease subunit S [Methanobrevibacter intestini]|uniref:restriction endonuclease subunit S n=1 Tax=Methanobrevibacter intestini TaxID=2911853 RepID=UPI003D0885BF